MIQFQPFRRATAVLAVLAAFGFLLSGCSSGGLAGDLISGRLVGGEDAAEIRVAAASTNVEAEGGKISVEVSNAGKGEMNWSASLSANWAKIEGEAKGAGTGTLSVVLEANAETVERTVTLSVSAGEASNSPQTVVLTQAGAEPAPAPVLNASAESYAVSAGGGSVAVALVNDGGGELDWSASLPSDASWVRFVGKSASLGEGSIRIEVDANSTSERRSFELTVTAEGASQSPQTLHFTQEAGAEAESSIDVSAAGYEIASDGGSVQVTVTAGDGVAWTAAVGGNPDWAQFSGPSGGTGDGGVTVRVRPNAGEQTRSFELTVTAEGASQSPQTLHFVQEASRPAVIVLTADPVNRTIPHTGGTVRVEVGNSGGGQLDWRASTNTGWASVAGTGSGTNSGSVVISASENEGGARAFTVTVVAVGAQNSPRTLRFTQAAAPERPRTSARLHADKYAITHRGDTVTISIDLTGDAVLDWEADPPQAGTTYTVLTPERNEQGELTGVNTEETRDRGEWVRILGASSGSGSGSLQLQVDQNLIALRWSFSIRIRFPDAPELDQTLHFSQDRPSLPHMSLWTATRHIGAGGGSVEAHLSTSSGGLIYWVAEVDAEWAVLDGAIDGEIDGTGASVIRIRVEPNAGSERSFTLTVRATDAVAPQPIVFRQAPQQNAEGAMPAPPPPPSWYANDCQRQTPGFEEFGGWLVQRGHYRNASDSRVWRHTTKGHDSNPGTLRVLADCTDNKRTLTTDIFADTMLDEPTEFLDLPVAGNARIVLLDIAPATVGEHTAGARHSDPMHVWPDDVSGWSPDYTQNGFGAKFLHIQPLGDWGYGSRSGWQSQLDEWTSAGSDMSAWADTARDHGWRLPSIQERTGEGLKMLANADTSLWLLVGGYTGTAADRYIHPNSAVCGEAKELCLFAPWEYTYTDEQGISQTASGTPVAAAQVAAALDNVLLLWPDYDLLELRDLVLGCAEDMGEEGPDSMWGQGVLSFNCLFTPQGELRDPRTDTILSGGIYGPLGVLQGSTGDLRGLAGGSMVGIDRTGRDYSYPITHWANRENYALLAATASYNASDAIAFAPVPGGVQGRSAAVLQRGGFSTRIAAAGDAAGAVAQLSAGGILTKTGLWTLRAGIALQPEGAGSLTGERAFRAPSTLSSAFSLAFQHSFTPRLSLHVQGHYWMTLDTGSRSLWAGAQLSEIRASASIIYRSSGLRAILQTQYVGGLSGRLDVAGKSIRLMPHTATQMSLRVNVPLGAPLTRGD